VRANENCKKSPTAPHSARAVDLNVKTQPLAALRVNPRNARTHSLEQIRKIGESITRFGFVNPLLVDADNVVIAGHGRLAAARQLGLQEAPTLRLEHLSEAEKRAYIIADNRLAELAGWDKSILALEFEELQALDFEVELTGFDVKEIDVILDGEATPEADPAEDIPEPQPAVSKTGDLWILGKHRLLCGDALDAASYSLVLDGDRADVVFTDPPYNVPIGGHVSGLGRSKHREFAMASGEMSPEAFREFLAKVCANLAQHSSDGSIHFICMDWRHVGEALAAGMSVYSEFKNLVVWNKDNGGMGSLYRSKHELIFVFKKGRGPHVNNVELGRNGRYRTNVWDYPGQNTFHRKRAADLAAHPTVKPVAMVADALRDVCARAAIALDPFCGSGTMIMACERADRRARAIEIDPVYVDVAIRRWEALSGQRAVHAATGQTFADLCAARAAESRETADE